jgi:hypothetical protein
MCGGLRNLTKASVACRRATTAQCLSRRPTCVVRMRLSFAMPPGDSQVQRVQLCDRYPHDAIALRDQVTVMRLGNCDDDTRVTLPPRGR